MKLTRLEKDVIYILLIWFGIVLVVLAHVPSFDIPILKALGIHPDMQY